MKLFRRKSQLTITPQAQHAIDAGMDGSDRGSVRMYEDNSASYGKLYRTQPAVRTVVDFLARNIAQIRLKVYQRNADGSSTELSDHPCQKLLDNPSPGVPRGRFMRQIVADALVYDRTLTLKVREQDALALVRVPMPMVLVDDQTFGQPLRFQIGTGPGQFRAAPGDVIWLHGYSPTSNNSGTSPMETLRQILAEENAAGRDRERSWRNGNRADGYFVREVESLEAVPEEQVARWEEAMKARSSGDKGAHGSPLLPPGYKYQKASEDAESSQYLGTRQLAREEVLRTYGIPLAVFQQQSGWAIDQYHQMLYQDTFAPWLVWLAEEFEEQLLYTEFPAARDDGIFLEFNIAEKMRGSFLDQAKIGQQAVGGPWMTINEFREKFQNLPPIDGGEELITPLNVTRAGGPQASPADVTNQHDATVVPMIPAAQA